MSNSSKITMIVMSMILIFFLILQTTVEASGSGGKIIESDGYYPM